MDVIFTDRFKTILQRSSCNLLSLISCGSLSACPDSRKMVKELANQYVLGDYDILFSLHFVFFRGNFQKIVCFSQGNFQPSSTHRFVMDWGLNHFLFDRSKIEQFLLEHQAIGAHTDIVQFQQGVTKTFRWTHVGARPLGFGTNPQCGTCKRLKTKNAKPNEDHSEIIHRCSVCKSQLVFTFPHGWKWVQGPPSKGDERGAWLVFEESNE